MGFWYTYKTKGKGICDYCKRKSFVGLVNKKTGEDLPSQYGKCDHLSSCGYSLFPPPPDKEDQDNKCYFVKCSVEDYSDKACKLVFENSRTFAPKKVIYDKSDEGCFMPEWFLKNNDKIIYDENKYQFFDKEGTATSTVIEIKPIEIKLIDEDLIRKSLGLKPNYLIEFLESKFGETITADLVKKYHIGTSHKKWEGATIYWHKYINGSWGRGKVMLYGTNGKRVKDLEGNGCVHSIHAMQGISDNKPPCSLYGEHLLPGNNLPVAIVESEKTAIIASVYLPQFIWVACGQLQGLNEAKCGVLRGRKAILFPDLKGLEKWREKALELKHITTFIVSDFLEKRATTEERAAGLDIADYLLKYDYRKFTNHTEKLKDGREIEITPHGYPAMWDNKPEKTEELLYWKLINHLHDLEAAFIAKDQRKVDNILDRIKENEFDHEMDIEDLVNEHAPTISNYLDTILIQYT